MPSAVFAQEGEEIEEAAEIEEPEPEELILDIKYDEVNAYGIIGERFEFKVEITYSGPEAKYFRLVETLPPGWTMSISSGINTGRISYLKLEPDQKEILDLICRPTVKQEPGQHIFIVDIVSDEEGDELSASMELTALVKASGEMELKTENEMYNVEIRPNKDNIYTLILENNGTAPVEDIEVSTTGEQEGWLIEFEDNIDVVGTGEKYKIETNIVPPARTIAGDYEIRFIVTSKETTDFVDIRTTVVTPIIWRILGIGLIALVIAGIAVIFERLGRR
jgi:uncharacterized membrane protein